MRKNEAKKLTINKHVVKSWEKCTFHENGSVKNEGMHLSTILRRSTLPILPQKVCKMSKIAFKNDALARNTVIFDNALEIA